LPQNNFKGWVRAGWNFAAGIGFVKALHRRRAVALLNGRGSFATV
jgi:hypothetical protein